MNTKHELSETDKQLKTHKSQLESLQNELISSRRREEQLVKLQHLADEQSRAIRALQVLHPSALPSPLFLSNLNLNSNACRALRRAARCSVQVEGIPSTAEETSDRKT